MYNHQLETFIRVADAGSFNKAAEESYITPTAIIKQIINELPLTLECELLDVIEGSLYLGEIKNVSMDESILGEDGELDLTKFVPITYDPIHHGYYPLGQRVGNAFADGAKLK